MTGRLTDRVALITGGASGIGAACAALFGREGADVFIVDVDQALERADATATQIREAGGRAITHAADVTSEEAMDMAVERCVYLLGSVDCVVAAAGVSRHPDQADIANLVDIDTEHWRFVLDVNLSGVFNTVRSTARWMRDNERPGSIITLASVAARIPTAGVYAVSKAGVAMVTRAFAIELAPFDIRVNALGPGYIETPMLEDLSKSRARGAEETPSPGSMYEEWAQKVPLGRLGTPEDVARVALFLSSEESGYITGSLLHPDGGFVTRFGGG